MNRLVSSHANRLKIISVIIILLFLIYYLYSYTESFSILFAIVCVVLPEVVFNWIANSTYGMPHKKIVGIMYRGWLLKCATIIISFVFVFLFLPLLINKELFIISYVVFKSIHVFVVSAKLRT